MAAGAVPHTLQERSFLNKKNLPPTPPHDHVPIAPANSKNPPMEAHSRPPTPDQTPRGLKPPRPPLNHQHSSHAESFITAEEEFSREQSREDLQSQDLQPANHQGDGTVDVTLEGSSGGMEEEPWRRIPGAFGDAPSIASSGGRGSKPKAHPDYLSTPSTKSSKYVRPKHYLRDDSSETTESSQEMVRAKQYQRDAESPVDLTRSLDKFEWASQVSYGGDEDKAAGGNEHNGTERHHETEAPDDQTNGHDGENDWDNHVSYISFDAEDKESVGRPKDENTAAGGPLSGHGRRIADELDVHDQLDGQETAGFAASTKPQNEPPTHHLLHKTGHLPEYRSPLPNVTLRNQKKKAMARKTPSSEEPIEVRQAREDRRREEAQTLALDGIPEAFLTTPPRTSNDLIYQQIQQANMERFAALDDARAVGATIIPSEEARNHSLRHVSKQQSLRSINAGGANCHSSVTGNSQEYASPLRHKKATIPQRSPLFRSPETPKLRSVSGPVKPILRHEKRTLSRTSRYDLQSESPPSQKFASPPRASVHPPAAGNRAHQLRHTSLPISFTTEANKAHTAASDSLNGAQDGIFDHGLRRSSKDYVHDSKRKSLHDAYVDENEDLADVASPASSTFLGPFGSNRFHNVKTPNSFSAWSDKTDMEVCEAQNVAIYPHSNESVLVVQNGSPASKNQNNEGNKIDTIAEDGFDNNEELRVPPLFSADATPGPPSIAVNGKSIHTVDSPLTNPRAPPLPPIIQCIPPTPNDEEDRQLIVIEDERRPSLAKRARRYSDIVTRPLLGRSLTSRHRVIRPSPNMAEKREDEKLHPNWVPNNIWEDEEEYWSDPEDGPFVDSLPPGGDTSEHPRVSFPRKMSKRLPGFRGSGGFLLGNSLGMDRHGTNKRRPHVELPSSSPAATASDTALQHFASTDSMRALAVAQASRRTFAIPGMKTRVQFVGFRAFQRRMEAIREDRREAAREKRRQEIRDQIGSRIVHNT